jgi:hypothetical protein
VPVSYYIEHGFSSLLYKSSFVSTKITFSRIGFWARIVNGKKEKISRTLYDILYQLDLWDVCHSKGTTI